MKFTGVLCFVFAALFCCGSAVGAEQATKIDDALSELDPNVILKSNGLKLGIHIFQKDTENEGFHGVLLEGHDIAKDKNKIYTFGTTKLRYYGAYAERLFPFSKSGWLPLDMRLIPLLAQKQKKY